MPIQSLCNFERSNYNLASESKTRAKENNVWATLCNEERKSDKFQVSRSMSRLSCAGRNNEDYNDDLEHEQQGSDLDSVLEALGSCSTSSSSGKPKTFSSDKMREIERNNGLLLKRIIANNHRPNQFNVNVKPVKVSHASVNRKKRQDQINHDNLVSTPLSQASRKISKS